MEFVRGKPERPGRYLVYLTTGYEREFRPLALCRELDEAKIFAEEYCAENGSKARGGWFVQEDAQTFHAIIDAWEARCHIQFVPEETA